MSRREKKIAFVEHPITFAEKDAIIDKGFKIVDIRFAPEKLPEGANKFEKPKAEKPKG